MSSCLNLPTYQKPARSQKCRVRPSEQRGQGACGKLGNLGALRALEEAVGRGPSPTGLTLPVPSRPLIPGDSSCGPAQASFPSLSCPGAAPQPSSPALPRPGLRHAQFPAPRTFFSPVLHQLGPGSLGTCSVPTRSSQGPGCVSLPFWGTTRLRSSSRRALRTGPLGSEPWA